MRNNSKSVAWIAAAFLLLCVISAYRQISMRFFPNDPVRPVAVYVTYLLLLAGWWASIRNRVTQRNMRFFLLAEHAVMLIAISQRFIQETLLTQNIYLLRMSGYLNGIPIIFFPLFGLYASFCLGKTEDYRINRNLYYLLIPVVVMSGLIITNESHQIIFRLMEDEMQPNLYFHPNTGVAMLIVWPFALEIIRIIIIYRRSRDSQNHSLMRFAPFTIAIFMLLMYIPVIARSFVVNIELFDNNIIQLFLEAMVWESCILTGMVPVNTHYRDVFDRSTVAMQILHEDGKIYQKSASAQALQEGELERLKREKSFHTQDGQELHLQKIRGGYAVWNIDISQIIATIDELRKIADELVYEGDLLRQELKTRSDEASVKEQTDIINSLTDEVGGQLSLLSGMLDKYEQFEDIEGLFKKICLIGSYVKRRCNLRLVERSEGAISNNELELCYSELIGCLQQMGVQAEMIWCSVNIPDPGFALFSFDLLEFLLERENFELISVKVALWEDATFTFQIHSKNGACAQSKYAQGSSAQSSDIYNNNTADEVRSLSKNKYEVQWQMLEDGYNVLVSGQNTREA